MQTHFRAIFAEQGLASSDKFLIGASAVGVPRVLCTDGELTLHLETLFTVSQECCSPHRDTPITTGARSENSPQELLSCIVPFAITVDVAYWARERDVLGGLKGRIDGEVRPVNGNAERLTELFGEVTMSAALYHMLCFADLAVA